MARKAFSKPAARKPTKATQRTDEPEDSDEDDQPRGEVKAMDVSLVGQGASGNERLADRVETAMNEAFEAAKQRGEKDPQKLLEAKIEARKRVLDSL